jgi:hypothetical protein
MDKKNAWILLIIMTVLVMMAIFMFLLKTKTACLRVGFYDNQLGERGTTTALFDYAHNNEKILKNQSFIFYNKTGVNNQDRVIQKFRGRFSVVEGIEEFSDIDFFIEKFSITHLYIIKSGENDGKLSALATNCVHCVFTCSAPHGDVYAAISHDVPYNDDKFPVVPHMIDLPHHNKDMRRELKIPKNATVFGGYGGRSSFSIGFVHGVVEDFARAHPDVFFLFANFEPFCDPLPNIIHLPMIVDTYEKVRFINTTNAMLWARGDGETFGIAIGEFSIRNKPVIAMKIGSLAHVRIHFLQTLVVPIRCSFFFIS